MLYGLLDTFVSNSVFSPSVTRFYLVIIVGIVMSVIWFFTFVFLIKKFDIKTPGREEVEMNADGSIAISESQATTGQDEQLVIDGLGGPDNIDMVTNCFTRLRVTVKNPSRVDKSLLESLQSSKGVVLNGKNIQVIIGMGVQGFKENVCDILGISE